jgi:hypothetical protein
VVVLQPILGLLKEMKMLNLVKRTGLNFKNK